MGANAMTANPMTLDAADPARATPVPEAAARIASSAPCPWPSSSLKRWVMWIE